MAGTVTVAEQTHQSVKRVHFSWTSDSSGDADLETSSPYNGKVLGLVTIPSGAAAPTDNYDVTLTDENGVDVLAGSGADRDTANTEAVYDQALLGVVGGGKLTLAVANAGSATAGEVIVFIR